MPFVPPSGHALEIRGSHPVGPKSAGLHALIKALEIRQVTKDRGESGWAERARLKIWREKKNEGNCDKRTLAGSRILKISRGEV